MGAALGPEQLENQIRKAVHDARLLIEARRRVDHAEDARPRAYSVEIAELALDAAEHRERRETCRAITLLDGQVAPDLAERRRQRAVGVQRAVAGDVRMVPKHAHEAKRKQDAGRRPDRFRQDEPQRFELRGDQRHLGAPSSKRRASE